LERLPSIPIFVLKEKSARIKAMAGGWTRDGAVQDQIDDTIADAVMDARARLPAGESLEYCEICGEDIPDRRRAALPGVRTCVHCQAKRDSQRSLPGINRRGSKDSQLR
jgi:phage/conjugal plasmid C-4 type zinc finger TraR family protein